MSSGRLGESDARGLVDPCRLGMPLGGQDEAVGESPFADEYREMHEYRRLKRGDRLECPSIDDVQEVYSDSLEGFEG